MKLFLLFASSILFFSCDQKSSAKKENNKTTDTSISNEPQNFSIVPKPDSIINNSKKEINIKLNRKIDTALLMSVSREILKYIKAKNYKKFASFIHPEDSIRFSPYAYTDTINSLSLSSNQFIQFAKQNKAIDWHSAWDSDMDPEIFTIDQYFKKYVYDVDFLNAELKSINNYHSQETDLNNINEAYPDCDVVEFFFSSFEEKYGGHDFRALRLVFRTKNKNPYLVGIVHDEWTP